MFRKHLTIALCIAAFLFGSLHASAHPGRTDVGGGHYDLDGYYHVHPADAQPEETTPAQPAVAPRVAAVEPELPGAAEGMADGRRDAAKLSVTSWRVGGFFLSVFAVGAAYLYDPAPPAINLVGKTPEYLTAYDRTYRVKARQQIRDAAMQGCIANLVLSAVVSLTEGNY